jgi:hypothetical protein
VLTTDTKCENQQFYICLVDLQTICINRGWNRVSLHIMIFVYVCSTCGKLELNTRFESWITWNEVNGVSLFHISFLITLMAYLCSQWTPNVIINYFRFDWSMYSLFVPNRGCKLVSPNNDFRLFARHETLLN